MKSFKRILITFCIILIVVLLNGIYYVFFGQFKSVKKLEQGKELTLYECCSVYTLHLAACCFSGILSPEAADQCLLMAFGKDGGNYARRRNFRNSNFIVSEIHKNHYRTFTVNFPLNEITANKASSLRDELRYALAYDGAVYKCIDNSATQFEEVLELDVKYDKYTAIYNIGPLSLKFNWQLLNYIQERGWLKNVHITYWY